MDFFGPCGGDRSQSPASLKVEVKVKVDSLDQFSPTFHITSGF